MIVNLLLATALQLNGTWEFRFEEGKAHHEVANPKFVATDSIVVPGCFDAMPKWEDREGQSLLT